MFDRRILLVIGAAALVAGVSLATFWLRIPNAPVQSTAAPKAETQTVLVATRPLKERALLRLDDIGWRSLPAADVSFGAYVRGAASPADLAGAVVRRDVQTGEVVKAEDIVKPHEPGFLSNVLGNGMRAIAIAVGPAEGAAGLIVPGDRVDVVLIQNFPDQSVNFANRSVSETVLSNLRVIAIDQTISLDGKARGTEARPGAPEPRIAKTVTLEVSPPQAEALMVAVQLGKVQLTLRNANDNTVPDRSQGPTWSSDVSPALKGLARERVGSPPSDVNFRSGPAGPGGIAGPKPSQSIEVLHGHQIEQRCFNQAGMPATDCNALAPSPTGSSDQTTAQPPASTTLRTPPAASPTRTP